MKLLPSICALTASALGQTPMPHHHPPTSPTEYARMLEDPSREEWQKPDAVVAALDLKPDQTVADIGAGSGYFARRFAAQTDAPLVTVSNRARACLGHGDLSSDIRLGPFADEAGRWSIALMADADFY